MNGKRNKKRVFITLMFLILTICIFSCAKGIKNQKPDEIIIKENISKASEFFTQGDFQNVIFCLDEADKILEKQPQNYIDKLKVVNMRAKTHMIIGQYSRALELFQKALKLSEKVQDQKTKGQILIGLAQIHYLAKDIKNSYDYLNQALKIAQETSDEALEAAVLNEFGNLDILREIRYYGSKPVEETRGIVVGVLNDSESNYDSAYRNFLKSATIARNLNNDNLYIKTKINASKTRYEKEEFDNALETLKDLPEKIEKMPLNYNKVYLSIALGDAFTKIAQKYPDDAKKTEIMDKAEKIMQSANSMANEINVPILQSYALGNIGFIYESKGNYNEALKFTNKALFKAQIIDANEAQMRWNWQAGRILKAQGNIDEAVSQYKQAVFHLRSISSDLLIGCKGTRFSFREIVGPVYFGLADILLIRANSTQSSDQKKQDLKDALTTIEQLKTAEIQDYFNDECITSLQSRVLNLEEISKYAAAIYPIILPDRTEVLVRLPNEIKQHTIRIDGEDIIQLINNFRTRLENPENNYYQMDSLRLYNLMIKPIEQDLADNKIDTLIFVPDGAFRTIPLSSLYDGEKFLIEKYAIATTPGLTLTDPTPIQKQDISLLIGGLTESVEGFSALPNVDGEISNIHEIYANNSKILKNKTFIPSNIETALKDVPYSMVHIASHGQFDSNPEKTFILTYNGKINMDELENLMNISQYREIPVELLALSACQTAVGDDRAALGLAGVALKAGARSAIASLWSVYDEATSKLISEFYSELKKSSGSKAQALQSAQIKLLSIEKYRHPVYWAPFLLIGNWL
ncbi:MAG: CHAT domain-containing protein [Desulfobacterales bacterium]|nr:CHAT domain-containing protein [Desulfobacterales bacterium]